MKAALSPGISFFTLPRYKSPTAKLASAFSLCSSTNFLSSSKAISTPEGAALMINYLFTKFATFKIHEHIPGHFVDRKISIIT